jgi:hypothetical protein
MLLHWITVHILEIFRLVCLIFFLSLQSALSLLHILAHSFIFLNVGSESEVKLSYFSREDLALGFGEELGQVMSLSSPLESFKFAGLREGVSSSAGALTALSDSWTVGICEKVKDCLCGWE